MNEEFKKHIEALEPAYRRLVDMHPITVPSLPTGVPGVYPFSEKGLEPFRQTEPLPPIDLEEVTLACLLAVDVA